MGSKEIIEQIRLLANDPLGAVVSQEFPTKQGIIRWYGGCVQVRRNGDKYFSFGMTPEEFFELVEVVPIEAS